MTPALSPRGAYAWLVEHSRETSALAGIAELLSWDQQTMLPPRGQAGRADQLAALARLLHQRATDPAFGARLAQAEDAGDADRPGSVRGANLREWRRSYDRTRRIPERLAVALARTCALAEGVWERARPKNDWKAFRPHLARVIALKCQLAEAVGYAREPYDALIEDFEPGETAEALVPIFTALRTALVDLLGRRGSRHPAPRRTALRGRFPLEHQQAFLHEILERIGFDFSAGRLDRSAHPFTVGVGPGDARITTVAASHDLFQALLPAIHEAGHGLYEQGLPAAHWGTPAGRPASMGFHESQSRLWENLVARSRGFWRYALPRARRHFPALRGIPPAALLRSIQAVGPSVIRVQADEVTYNLHIVARFELELALLRRELSVGDLPAAFDRKMLDLLGITPKTFSEGVMQDVHWGAGLIGYFPTYTLGNLYGAQLFAAAEKQLGPQEPFFARGEFGPLRAWLRAKVHRQGGRFRPRELIRRITGQPLSAQPLLAHLERRYLDPRQADFRLPMIPEGPWRSSLPATSDRGGPWR
jgi:carboxypeptidase Taq